MKTLDHFHDLCRIFNPLQKKGQLGMDPLKCALSVTLGKFLGFVVWYRGIKIYQAKIRAIHDMPPPKNLKELRGFRGLWHTSEDSYQILLHVATILTTSWREGHPSNGMTHAQKLLTALKSTCTWQTPLTLHCDTRVFTWGTMCPKKLWKKGEGPLLPKSHIGWH